MAVTKIHRQHVPNDFENNELLNVVLQHLVEEPVINTSGKIYYNSFKKIPFYSDGTEWIPFFGKPVQFRYTDEASMLAEQPIHNNGYLYYRSDEDIYYEYLGTTNGTMVDYNPIGGSGVSNNEVRVIYVNPDLLSGVGTLESQVVEYINTNIEIDYSKQFSKVNIVLGADPNINQPEPNIEIVFGLLYNGYVHQDSRKITSSDEWRVATKFSQLGDNNGDWDNLFGSSSFVDVFEHIDTNPLYWDNLTPNATNSSGLNLRGSGWRFGNSFFDLRNNFIGGSAGVSLQEFIWDRQNTVNGSTGQFSTTSGFGNGAGLSIRLVKTNTSLNIGETGVYEGNDGKIYRTICVNTLSGPVEWLADNLAETKYRNGDNVLFITDTVGTEWDDAASNSIGAACFYDNDESNAFIIEGGI